MYYPLFKILFLVLLSNLFFSCSKNSKTTASSSTETSAPSETISDQPSKVEMGKKVTLEPFSFEEWPEKIKAGDGCSCVFRPDKDNFKAYVFANDMQSRGCVKLDRKMQLLTGGRTDERMHYYEQVNDKYWITLNEKGDQFIFKNRINFDEENWYDHTRQELIKTLLVMDKLPKEIPMKINGQLGMGFRGEIRSMLEEALQMAQAEKKKGNTGMPIEMIYENAEYKCKIIAKVSGKTNSGGDEYMGEMIIKSIDGKIVDRQTVWGACGC